MNIGIFTDTYFPQINGVSTSVRILSDELTRLGHKVYIFTTSDPQAGENPQIFRLPSMPVVFLKSHRLALVYPPKLLSKLKYLELDIIHTQTEFTLGFFGKLIADFYKLPHVHTYHTMYEDYVHYVAKGYLITPKMAQQYSRIFCNRADAVISPAEKTRLSLIEYGVERPIHLIPTGVDFSPFAPGRFTVAELEAAKKELGINEDDRVIVTIARVAKEKSIDVVVKAMPEVLKQIPKAKFLIVGDGPVKEDLMDLSKRLGISKSVIFAGSRPWDIIGKYYQLGEVFVTASTSETQGLTYIEAVAAGVPVVARADSSIEGIIVNNETGYLFESEAGCAKCLCDALNDLANRPKICANAMSRISNLSSENFGKSISRLYEGLVRGIH